VVHSKYLNCSRNSYKKETKAKYRYILRKVGKDSKKDL
jgi:hypothetical protein